MTRRCCALGLLALAACKDGGDSGAASPWLVEAEDLGAPRAQGATLDLSAPGLWQPLAEVVPYLQYDDPATEVPFTAWGLATSDRVADMGTCPDIQTQGSTTIWQTWGCRTSQGYEMDGQVEKTEWTDGATGWQYARWDFALQVNADVDDPQFDELAVDGALVYVIGDGETLDHAVQVNVRTHMVGYWSRQNASDPREALWNDWAVTARYEETLRGDPESPRQVFRMDGAAEVGDLGAFSFHSEALDRAPSCGTAPDGVVHVVGAQDATLTWTGASSCSTCAERTLDGADAGTVCRS